MCEPSPAAPPHSAEPAAKASAVTRAFQLKRQLYDNDVKLVDLFGDLEPKMMLNAIMELFWAPHWHFNSTGFVSHKSHCPWLDVGHRLLDCWCVRCKVSVCSIGFSA